MTRLSTRSLALAAVLVMPNTAMPNTATWAASQNTRTPVLPGSWNIPQRTPMMSATVDNNSHLLRAGYVFFTTAWGHRRDDLAERLALGRGYAASVRDDRERSR